MHYSKLAFLALLTSSFATVAQANVEPTVVINSAAMRDGTTLMDISYRVIDPDDATVKIRSLAFVDGVRSFANVLRPETFAEGTAANLGDAIATNTDHTLAWDVGADWDIDLGQVKFEVLAQDSRGLLEFDWITIPAAGGEPELTISLNGVAAGDLMDALFWQYANTDSGLLLENGVLWGTNESSEYEGLPLSSGDSPATYAAPFLFKRMNLEPATYTEAAYAMITARANLTALDAWHAKSSSYVPLLTTVAAWGSDGYSMITGVPAGLTDITSVASGRYHSLALTSDGIVTMWGWDYYKSTVPDDLVNVTAIAVNQYHSLALKSDGTVIGWGASNSHGANIVPDGLTDVVAVSAGLYHSVALKNDGMAVAWGDSSYSNIPSDLGNVTAISTSLFHTIALKSDGTVLSLASSGTASPPSGLTDVISISAGSYHYLALKNDGTVIGWKTGNSKGADIVPEGLMDVIAIAAGDTHSLALKSDGTVVAWGDNTYGQTTIPANLTGVTSIVAGERHSFAIKSTAP